jgi:hypothetical protein
MKEEAVEALNEILDALQDVLEDPVFTARADPPRTSWDAFIAFVGNGFKFHDDAFVISRLELIDEQRPGKLAALAAALEKACELQGLQSSRDRSPWYKLATAPLFLPQIAGILCLLKFSTREAQWVAYYGVWLVQAIGMSLLVSLLSPTLVPGVLMWCILSEMMEKDLDTEELLGSLFLFRMLRASIKMEHVLDLCQEKGVECGRLMSVSERFSTLRVARRRWEREEADASGQEERPTARLRVNLLRNRDE